MKVVNSVMVLIVAISLAVLGSIVTTAVFMPGCGLCHSKGELGAATAAGTHADVACGSCHGGVTAQSRLRFGTTVVLGMVAPIMPVDPSVSSVETVKCTSCHAKALVGTVEASGLRISHASCAKTRQCTDCHSTVAHGSAVQWPLTTTMELCYDCHGVAAVPSACDTCHTARLPSDRVQTGVFAVTHGPNHEQTHGMGDMDTCGQCHVSSKCTKCHGPGLPHQSDFVTKHGDVAQLPAAKCRQCHTAKFCVDCHVYPMPHSSTFVAEHGRVVELKGQTACQRCHAPTDCSDCHVDHVHPVTTEQLQRLGVNPDGSGGQ
jgi:predicted CXXCH cytochrome family protein